MRDKTGPQMPPRVNALQVFSPMWTQNSPHVSTALGEQNPFTARAKSKAPRAKHFEWKPEKAEGRRWLPLQRDENRPGGSSAMGGGAARSGGLRGSFRANRSISRLQGEGGGTLGPQGSHRSPGLPCPKRVSRGLPSLPEGASFSRAGGAPGRPARPVILQEAEMPVTLPSSPVRSPTSGPALGVPAPKPPDPKEQLLPGLSRPHEDVRQARGREARLQPDEGLAVRLDDAGQVRARWPARRARRTSAGR